MNQQKVLEASVRFVDELNTAVLSKSPLPFVKGLTEDEKIYFAQGLTNIIKAALETSEQDLRDYNR